MTLEGKDMTVRQLIEKYCMPFLKRSGKKGLLYRGVKQLKNYQGTVTVGDSGSQNDDDWAVYLMPVRKDREAMSTSPKLSKVIDDWFEEEKGIKARSQAVFCYGERGRSTAQGYGNHNCVLFPVGQFTYTWSPNVMDLYNNVFDEQWQREGNDVVNIFKKPGKYQEQEGFDPELVGKWMESKKYTINDLDKAVVSDSEIMIDCDQYIAFEYNGSGDLQTLRDALGIKY
jgi:hypothetical protein